MAFYFKHKLCVENVEPIPAFGREQEVETVGAMR